MADEESNLGVRRGRPLSEYGALFPGGQLWHWILGLSYAGLVGLEAIGNEAWRVAATPYLDASLFIGLIPTLWRVTRPATEHAQNAQTRSLMAELKGAPVDKAMLDDYGLLDEKGALVDDTPPAWQDELTAEPKKSDPLQFVLRVIATPVLAFAVWIALLLGLSLVDWLRDHWIVTAAIAGTLAVIIALIWHSYRRAAAAAVPTEPT